MEHLSVRFLHSPPETGSTSMFSSATCSLGVWRSKTLRYTYTHTHTNSKLYKNTCARCYSVCGLLLYCDDLQWSVHVFLHGCWLVVGCGNTSWCHGRCESLWWSVREDGNTEITTSVLTCISPESLFLKSQIKLQFSHQTAGFSMFTSVHMQNWRTCIKKHLIQNQNINESNTNSPLTVWRSLIHHWTFDC